MQQHQIAEMHTHYTSHSKKPIAAGEDTKAGTLATAMFQTTATAGTQTATRKREALHVQYLHAHIQYEL
jgi:hypothetical protein